MFFNLYVTVCSSIVFFVPEQLARCVDLMRNKGALRKVQTCFNNFQYKKSNGTAGTVSEHLV